MKLITLPKTIFCLALLLVWGLGAPQVAAQTRCGPNCTIEIVSDPFVQTVNVRTPRGNYTATFAQDTVVYPDGSANGVLTLTDRNGVPQSYLVTAGSVRFITRTENPVLLLRAQGPDGEVIIASRPDTDPTQPCRIYDILGSQADAPLRFEAQVRITVIRN